MNCPLCKAINRILKNNISKEKWSKKIGDLIITGERYYCDKRYDIGYVDIVRYKDSEFLFVNSIRQVGRNRDGVIFMPIKHIDKYDLRKDAKLLANFDKAINEFINKTYKKVDYNVRVFENYGNLASVPEHAHKQIWYSKSKGVHFPFKKINYV